MKSNRWQLVTAIISFAVLTSLPLLAEERHLTLTEAVKLALAQNRGLKIARLKILENKYKKAQDRASYFPLLTNQSNALHVTDLQSISIPAGAFGSVAGTFVPAATELLPQGRKTYESSGTMLAQPLTQLVRIHAANRAAAADIAASQDDERKSELQLALQVHNLYFGALIANLQKRAAEQQVAYAEEHLKESEEDVRNGNALKSAAIEGRADLLEGHQSVLTADLQLADLNTELNDAMGLPLDTKLDLDPSVPSSFDLRPQQEYTKTAWTDNPEILAAEATVRKASAGVTAARSAYLPDITAYARQSYQNGSPLFPRNFGTFGLMLDWTVFDFGKRRAALEEKQTQLSEAQENLERLKDEVAVQIEMKYNKVERTKQMVQVAHEVVLLRHESERVTQNQMEQGVVLVSQRQQASSSTYKAEADLLQANLGYLLAYAELEQVAGLTPNL